MLRFTWMVGVLFSAFTCSAAPYVMHVATNGNDLASGRLNGRPGDGALATLGAALRKIRALHPPNGVTIFIHGGVYRLAEPIRFLPEDSGINANKPFIIAAFGEERPVLSGGMPLSHWQPVRGSPNLWQADARAELGTQWRFRSLFIDGRRAVRARTPNEGHWFTMDGARFNDKPFQFKFHDTDVKPSWKDAGDAEVVVFEKWTNIRQYLRGMNGNVLTLSGTAYSFTREKGARYFIENAPDAIDVPDEWRLDSKRGLVTAMFKPGENPNKMEIVVPRLQELILFQGDPARGKPVHHIFLRGLTLADTDWSLDADGYQDSQGAAMIRGDVFGEGMIDCGIENCRLTRLGGYGIDLGWGCQRNRIVGNEIFDLGAGGVRVGEVKAQDAVVKTTHSNTITDNHLHHLGRIYPPAVGLLIMQTASNHVAYNHVHDLFYTAISVGWTWGYQANPCRGNVIEFNDLHDIGQGLLSDMGGIYTLGPQAGTIIRNNLIHDVNAFTYGGWGLYTDEGSTGILLENNVVYHCKSAGFHQHYGKENVVRNNVFAFNTESQLMRTRDEPHISFYFTNNIVLFDSGNLLANSWMNDRFVIDRNLYWDTRWNGRALNPQFSGATLAQWKTRGHDQNSVFAYPNFLDAAKGDFRLNPNSPALQMGFKPIDISKVGVRPPGRRN